MHLVFCGVVIFIVGDGPTLVYCSQEAEQTLAIILGALAENLFGSTLYVLCIDPDFARRSFKGLESDLLQSHESDSCDCNDERSVSIDTLGNIVSRVEDGLRQILL